MILGQSLQKNCVRKTYSIPRTLFHEWWVTQTLMNHSVLKNWWRFLDIWTKQHIQKEKSSYVILRYIVTLTFTIIYFVTSQLRCCNAFLVTRESPTLLGRHSHEILGSATGDPNSKCIVWHDNGLISTKNSFLKNMFFLKYHVNINFWGSNRSVFQKRVPTRTELPTRKIPCITVALAISPKLSITGKM